MEPLRVLELYSGIGGMHQALRESHVPAQVVAAIDVNTVANEVYKYNFPHTLLLAKTIEGITLEEFDRLSFNMILMSPPCQPFTRIGLQGDKTDPRTSSFLYILDILPRDLLIQTIENCGFQYQEFLLSPTSVMTEFPKTGSENPQKYAIDAEKNTEEKKIEPSICLDGNTQCSGKETILFKLETTKEIDRKHQQNSDLSVQMLEDFLEHDIDINQYFLPPKLLQRYALILDIVKPTCRRSTCFTKGYGRFIEGTGSVLQTAEDVQIENIYKSISNLSEEEKITKLLTLKLRYFTPKEIANLLGFPPQFGFPEMVTVKQRYCLLGNSLNVHIVAKLIKILYQ
ncbi:tRNA (cytosine(38)-C(5))-methyltransferase isoform 5-T5 [Trichechus inunguis]